MVAVVTSGWSAVAATLTSTTQYSYTATPGAGGSLVIQYTVDGTTWTTFANAPAGRTSSGNVPLGATGVRATALGVAGDVTTQVAADNGPGTLTASQVTGLYRGLKVGIFGDSITQENYDQAAASNDERPRWFTQANSLLGRRMNLVNNAGVAGETTTQMLARLRLNGTGQGVGFGGIGAAGSAVTTQPSPLYGGPNFVFVHAGVNDIYGFTTADSTITGNLQAIYQALQLAGATPIAMTIMPVTTATVGYTTAKAAQHARINTWIRNYCAANPNIILVDAFKAMVDPTNAAIACITGVTRDGLQHPNNLGGLLVAREIQNVLQYIIPPYSPLPSSNAEEYTLDASLTQILPNPLLTGTAAITATGFTGATAGSTLANANFTRGAGAGSVTLSAVTRADGFGQNIKMVLPATASGDNWEIRFPSQHARAVVGGTYIAVCEITVTGPAGAALAAADGIQGVQLYIQYNDGTSNFFAYSERRGSTDVALVGSFTKTLQTAPIAIPASGTPTILRPNFTVYSSGASTFPEVQIGRVGLIRIA